MKHLIIGYGSIGKRHSDNLISLGEEIVRFDRSKDKIEDKLEEVDSVFITCPTAFHMDFALKAAKANKHIFIEKPVSHNLENVKKLYSLCQSNDKICFIGYNFRFHKDLIEIKNKLKSLGKVEFVKVEVGEYLPGWHPDEDYRQGYAARSDMGGGVVLTLSHEIDYIRWLFGSVTSGKAFIGKVSNLDIDVEDTASIILKSDAGTLIELHMDYIQKPAVRTMKIKTESEIINWDYYENKSFDRNQMFIDEASHYLDCCHKKAQPIVTKKEVLDVMNIIEMIKSE